MSAALWWCSALDVLSQVLLSGVLCRLFLVRGFWSRVFGQGFLSCVLTFSVSRTDDVGVHGQNVLPLERTLQLLSAVEFSSAVGITTELQHRLLGAYSSALVEESRWPTGQRLTTPISPEPARGAQMLRLWQPINARFALGPIRDRRCLDQRERTCLPPLGPHELSRLGDRSRRDVGCEYMCIYVLWVFMVFILL